MYQNYSIIQIRNFHSYNPILKIQKMMKGILIIICFIKMIVGLPQIYGVRWYLGDGFKFNLPDNLDYGKGTKYIVAFNSQQQINVPITLVIDEGEYTCSSRHLQLTSKINKTDEQDNTGKEYSTNQTFQTYIHLCYIDYELTGDLDYSIVTLDTQYKSFKDKTYLLGKEQVTFFSGRLRALYKQQDYKMLVMGDWGQFNKTIQITKGFIPIMKCLTKTIKQHPQIRGVLFVGDIGYNFEGDTYISMLKFIQPITSQMIWIMTPGNHDTVYYDAGFVLFTQSIRTPQWSQYHNYFSMIDVGQNFIVISYNPQYQVEGYSRMSKSFNLSQTFKKELPPKITQYLAQNRTVLIMSHYPIYCSDPTDTLSACQQNRNRFKHFHKYFKEISMDLYLSGHLHLYERTYPICYSEQNPQQLRFGDKFIGDCPTYIVQGDAGNRFYVQMKQQYPLSKFTAKIGYNTGYGLLSILKQKQQPYPNLSYQHFTGQCESNDYIFIKTWVPQTINKIVIVITVMIVLFFLTILIGYLVYRRSKPSTLRKDTVQMVEEEVQSQKEPKKGF